LFGGDAEGVVLQRKNPDRHSENQPARTDLTSFPEILHFFALCSTTTPCRPRLLDGCRFGLREFAENAMNHPQELSGVEERREIDAIYDGKLP
jgi:hypothetical protein